jgi:hypothetical protein
MSETIKSLIKSPYQLPPAERLFTPNIHHHIANYYQRELGISLNMIANVVGAGLVESGFLDNLKDGQAIQVQWPIEDILDLVLVTSHDSALDHVEAAINEGLDRACDYIGIDAAAQGFYVGGDFSEEDRSLVEFIILKQGQPPLS